MRFLRLDLIACGPFTQRSIVFEPHPALQLVVGRNEAGKSSVLRALRSWLYGFPHNSPDSFVHPYSQLRVGGVIEGANGERFAFIRRKGNTKTLRGPDDKKVLVDGFVDALLSGINETLFIQQFGIDYEQLRQGGHAILSGGGELGEILFAAGAGIADVRKVHDTLDDELKGLFKPAGSVPRINQALKQWKEACDDVRSSRLAMKDWTELDRRLHAAEQRKTDLDRELRASQLEQGRLERLKKAISLLRSQSELHERHAEFAAARCLPDDFASLYTKALADLKNAEQAEQEASREIDRLTSAAHSLSIPEGLLQHQTAFRQLHEEWGACRKAAIDRPELVARAELALQQARELLEGFAPSADLDNAAALRISHVQRHRIQALSTDFKAVCQRQQCTDQAYRRLCAEWDRTVKELADLPPVRDVASLKRSWQRAQKLGGIDGQLRITIDRCAELEARAAADLQRLPLWDGPLHELESLPVPSNESIDRCDRDWTMAESALRKAEERLAELQATRQSAQQALETLLLESNIPSEEDLVAARRRREDGWTLVQQLLKRDQPENSQVVARFVKEFAPDEDLPTAYAASVKWTDEIADRLRRESGRVHEKARYLADLKKIEEQLAAAERSLDEQRMARQAAQADWNALWIETRISPLTPREMMSWRTQQSELVKQAQQLRQQQSLVTDMQSQVHALRLELADGLMRLGESLSSSCATVTQILDRVETVLTQAEVEQDRFRECQVRRDQLEERRREAQHELDRAQRDLVQWQEDWTEAISVLQMEEGIPPAAANSVIESIERMLERKKEADGLQKRIKDVDADARAFEIKFRQFLAEVAADLKTRPLAQAVADLHDRVETASIDQAKQGAWSDQRVAEERKRGKSRDVIQQASKTLDELCRMAGCDTVQELPLADANSKQRRELDQKLTSIQEQLLELAQGGPLEDFVIQANAWQPDAAEQRLLELRERLEQIEKERSDIATQIGSLRTEMRQMDGNGRAAEARERAEQLAAQIRNDAEHYARLRLASSVLRRTLERFRAASQGPVLERAGALFAELTLGSFEGLRADFDDQGQGVLVGLRGGTGQLVPVGGMSDGTCDQLYLALRLALLESYLAKRSDPVPLILDDILVMFDDDRAVATLKILAQLAERTQVIFFTHHEHLVQLARDCLDDGVLAIHTFDTQANNNLEKDFSPQLDGSIS